MKYRLECRRGELVISGEAVDYVGGRLRIAWEKAFEGFALAGRPWERVLLLGMGASLMQILARTGAPPPTHLTIVERDPDMVRLQQTHYELPLPYELILDDAATALTNLAGVYDGIFVDAFEEKTVPPQLLELDFVQSLAKRLNSVGILLWNIVLPTQQRLLKDRLERVFPCVYKRHIWENAIFLAAWERTSLSVPF